MSDQSTANVDRAFLFGRFRLLGRQRLLLENGEPVRLGCRAIEILIALIERTGELVAKGELIVRVWPQTVVVAANLTAQMTALRRALRDGRDGNRYIVNDSGRGYRFVAPVTTVEARELAPAPRSTPAPLQPVSPSLLRLVELCHGFAGQQQSTQPSPQTDCATVDAILQRGILALELARTLVSTPDEPAGGQLVLGRHVSRGVETNHPARTY